MVLDGWILARAPASPAQGFQHIDLSISFFLVLVRCVALRYMDLLIKTGWSIIYPFYC